MGFPHDYYYYYMSIPVPPFSPSSASYSAREEDEEPAAAQSRVPSKGTRRPPPTVTVTPQLDEWWKERGERGRGRGRRGDECCLHIRLSRALHFKSFGAPPPPPVAADSPTPVLSSAAQ